MIKKQINFLKLTPLFLSISSLLVIFSFFIIAKNGFNYGVDFAGGTEIQVQFNQPVTDASIRQFLSTQKIKNFNVQSFDEKNEFLIRLDALSDLKLKKLTSNFKSTFSSKGFVMRRVDSVGPQIGSELKKKGLLALFYSLLIILIYVGLRFDYEYAPGAVICLFHDVVITLGIFSLLQREVNLQTLAAVLTIIGYSLNDTIVTFDRIRENIALYRDKTFSWIINSSLNDVLSRTILTSLTTSMAVFAMYFWADGVIRDFAFTLGIGVIVGTYSSIYIASPLVQFITKFKKT
ncbi:MAG: protein translocase subunit SecF [Bdellovibrionaceae bacterium]|nr:protein translocase subunit SecF [Pseudobdellovibrionaceae bacterium]